MSLFSPLPHSRSSADYIAKLERVVLHLRGNQTRDVCDVGHQIRSLLVGNLAETTVLPVTWVSRSSADDNSGLEEVGILVETVVVN